MAEPAGAPTGAGHSELVTARLRGAPPRRSDLDALAGLLGDERVGATLGGARTRDQAEELLRADIEHWRQHGFGSWLLWVQEDGTFAGRVGLRRIEVADRDEVELSWIIVADRWRQGLATEAGAAAATAAFERFGLESVVALADAGNVASERVAEKLGMQPEAEVTWTGRPHRLYRLAR